MKGKKRIYISIGFLGVILIAIGFPFLCRKSTFNAPIVSLPQAQLEYNIPVDSFHIEKYTVQQNEVLAGILQKLGVSIVHLSDVNALNSNVFDMRSVRAGNQYKAFFSTNDTSRYLCYLVYEKSPVDYSVFCFQDTLCVYHGKKEIEKRLVQSKVQIESSLWNAIVEKGITPKLAMDLSDIYAWTIDFFGLQKGDGFTAIYDELYVDTAFMGIGQIHAVEFSHRGKNHYAFCFKQDSINDYWDEDGNSLRRAFLKAPLKFSRISSHFSYSRKHPVLRTVRPHTGIDYAAPSGTPVVSIGSGTVIEKGYKGGGGHTVKIRHNAIYTTAYLHLSKYANDIKVGNRIAQGQVIGYVGSTGLSTGSHLDFRVWKDGTAINPLSVESPPIEPIRPNSKQGFDSIRNLMQKGLSAEKLPRL